MGYQSGYTNQSAYSISIGYQSALQNQNVYSTAIGYQAGYSNQGQYATAIGYQAGQFNQGNETVAIGQYAGFTGQGYSSIAIGYLAGYSNQPLNSICINASGSTVNPINSNSCVITPVRNVQYAGAYSAFAPLANNNLVYYPAGNEVIQNPCVSFMIRLQGYFSYTINGNTYTSWRNYYAPQAGYDLAYNNGLYNGKLNQYSYYTLNCGSSQFTDNTACYFICPQTGIYQLNLDFGQTNQTAGNRVVIGLCVGGVFSEIIDYQTGSTLDQINYSCSFLLQGGLYVYPYCVTTPNFAVGNFSMTLLIPTF